MGLGAEEVCPTKSPYTWDSGKKAAQGELCLKHPKKLKSG